MGRARVIGIVGVGVGLLLVPGTGHADHMHVAPPFDSRSGFHECTFPTVGTCISSASVELEGRLSIAGAIDSPHALIPGSGSANAFAELGRRSDLLHSIPGIDLTVTIDVDHASAVRSGGTPGGRGWVVVYLFVGAGAHCACSDFELLTLVAGPGGGAPTLIEDEDVVVTLRLENRDGGPITPGPVGLSIQIYGETSLGGSFVTQWPDTGTSSFDVDLRVTSVIAHVG